MAHAIALARTNLAPMREASLRFLIVGGCAAALIFAKAPIAF